MALQPFWHIIRTIGPEAYAGPVACTGLACTGFMSARIGKKITQNKNFIFRLFHQKMLISYEL